MPYEFGIWKPKPPKPPDSTNIVMLRSNFYYTMSNQHQYDSGSLLKYWFSFTFTTLLRGCLASFLMKKSDSHKRHKKSHFGSDAKKNKYFSRQEKTTGNNISFETGDYFRELTVDDVEKINEAFLFKENGFILILNTRNNYAGIVNMKATYQHSDVVVASREERDVITNNLMEVDGVGGIDISQNQQDVEADCVLPQLFRRVEWLFCSRYSIYLTSKHPFTKKKLLGGEGLEKLFVAHLVKELNQSTCWYNCSLGDMDNQLNIPNICTTSGVVVHQSCYSVQQDGEAGCWLCSWCRLKRDEDKPGGRSSLPTIWWCSKASGKGVWEYM